jgi:hypothetical protein
MVDFGVLKTLKDLIAGNSQVQNYGYDDVVCTTSPTGKAFPMILLELEEVWTSMKLGNDTASTRLKLKASIVGKSAASREPITVADTLRSVMDGTILDLQEGKRGIVRLSNSVIDLPNANRPRMVQQFYEVLIRG